MGLNLYRNFYASMWDENGEHINFVKFKRKSSTFKHNNKSYNVKLKDGSYYDDNRFFYNRRIYLYQHNCPDPIVMDEKKEPLIKAEVYNIMLETKQLQKLNEISKAGFNLNFKQIVLGIAVLVGAYLLFTGQLF